MGPLERLEEQLQLSVTLEDYEEAAGTAIRSGGSMPAIPPNLGRSARLEGTVARPIPTPFRPGASMSGLPQNEPHPDAFVRLIEPQDVLTTLASLSEPVQATILDPWYNRGIGGVVPGYADWLQELVKSALRVSPHVYLWGFPDIVYRVLDHLPERTELVAWLTWYYKNCPSVIRGWRSAQYTCLHLARTGAKLYPEHFLNDAQNKNRPKVSSATSRAPLRHRDALIGFVGRDEQTGHPSQKPLSVIAPLIEMVTQPGDTVLDPMCGSGTTGVAAHRLGRNAILCDISPEYLEMTQNASRPSEKDSLLSDLHRFLLIADTRG